MRAERRPPLPASVRVALAALSEMDAPCDARAIDAVMAGFDLRRSTLRQWWSEPSPWSNGERPIVLLRRGEGHRVFLSAATAILQAAIQLREAGLVSAVHVIAARLEKAGAPSPIIKAIANIGLPACELPVGTANEP